NNKDPEVSTTSELFALACGPTWTPISINSCVVDGVRYVVHSRDERHIIQNNSICSPGPHREMYYGQLQEILEFNLNDLDNATLHIYGQSTKVDVPPDIIDVVDEDDDITDDEDALPHDLAESDNEDLINVDDDGVDKMSAEFARSHDGDGGGKDRPLHTMYPAVAWVALLTEEEMRRLEATSTYTDDEINRLVRGGKQRGHIAGAGGVLPARATASPSTPMHESTLNSLHKKVDFMVSLFKSDSKYSDMFSQFESGGASGSSGCGDEEEGADHQDNGNEDGDGDT
nr:F-box domain, leucine-rich repeat domain, L domain-like protein [Tanacetum cinerariifolium]